MKALNRRLKLLCAVFAASFLALSPAKAQQVLFGADGAGGSLSTLYILNPANGAIASTVGPVGFSLTGLRFNPNTSVLYGVTNANSPTSPDSLVTINLTSGAGTLVGALGNGDTVGDIAFVSSGVLFGSGQNSGHHINTINLTTGAGTKLPAIYTAGATGSTGGGGLAANAADTLYVAGNQSSGSLRTVDQTTGAGTTVATLNGAPIAGSISALAFNAGGTLFGADLASAGGGGLADLVTINLSTGAVTNLGSSVAGLTAIAFSFAVVPVAGGSATPPSLVIREVLLADTAAITSLLSSGLPMAQAQREISRSAVGTALRDVNGRLFRLRSQGLRDEQSPSTGSGGPRGDEKMTIEDHGKEVELPRSAPFQRYEFFASGDFGNTDRDAIRDTVGFNQNTWAGTTGFEYRICREAAFGLAVTGLESDADLGRNVGSVDLTGFAVTSYLSVFWKNLYFDALYSYGRFEHDLRRRTFFGDTAHASPDSDNHAVYLNLGYDLKLGGLVTGPFAALEYTTSELGGYTETGAGRFNARVAAQNYDSLVSRVGWQASYPIRTRLGTVTPQFRTGWVRTYRSNDEPVQGALRQSPFVLVNAGGANRVGGFSATANTSAPGRDALSVGGGVMSKFGDHFSLMLDYEIQLAQANNLQQFASVRVSVEF